MIPGTMILVQRNNFNGLNSKFFNRTYAEYENGFGSPSSLYWIGLKSLHQLTQNNTCSARFILQKQPASGIPKNTWTSRLMILPSDTRSTSAGSMETPVTPWRTMMAEHLLFHVVHMLEDSGDSGDCAIAAGINFVSSDQDFSWSGPDSTRFPLRSTEFWLYC